MEKHMVSTFMEITRCESEAYAVQHLGSCRWNLDEAVNVYFNSGGGPGADPSGVSAQIPSEVEVAMEEEDDNGGSDDDVHAPIPARVEALYEYDPAYYYGDHSAAHVSAFATEAPHPAPVPAFPAPLGEIQATGWGEEPEPGYGGHARAEDVDAGGDDAAAEQEGNSNSNEADGGRMVSYDDEEDSNNEQSDDDKMSYDSSGGEIDDYGLDMDEDDDYYASIADDGAEEEQPRPAVRRPQQQKSSLDDMYKLPVDLMCKCDGSFHYAKVHATTVDRFLLVNLQGRDFQSELYNRDLWSDEQVRGVVKESLVLFLVQKESTSSRYWPDECSMLCTFYKLEDHQLPAVLVLDPITGMLMEKWSGPMTPDEFLQFVGEYTASKPSTMSVAKFPKRSSAAAVAAAVDEQEQEPAAAPEIIPKPAAESGEQEPDDKSAAPAAEADSEAEEPAPEPEAVEEEEEDDEPMEGEKMYRLRIRFPDGTMFAKEFGCKRRVASLFAFCRTAVRGGREAAEQKAFRIVRFAGGRFEPVQGDGGVTFEDLGLNCATVSVVFDA